MANADTPLDADPLDTLVERAKQTTAKAREIFGERSFNLSVAVNNVKRLARMFEGLPLLAEALEEIGAIDNHLRELKLQISAAEQLAEKRKASAAAAEASRIEKIAAVEAEIEAARERHREAEAECAVWLEKIAGAERDHAAITEKLATAKAQLRQLAAHAE